MRKWFIELLKWLILIIVAAIAVYFSSPKYEFIPVTIHIRGPLGSVTKTIYVCRCNKFTGAVDFLEEP